MSSSTNSISQFIQIIGAENSSTTSDSTRKNVERIDEEINKVKVEIQSRIQSEWSGFHDQWKTGFFLLQQSTEQEKGLREIEESLGNPDNGLIPLLLNKLQKHQELASRHCDLALSFQCAFQSLSDFDKLLENGSLETAVERLEDFKSSVEPQRLNFDKSWLAKRAVNEIKELEEDLKQRLIDSVRDGIIIQKPSETGFSVIEMKKSVVGNKHAGASSILWSSAMVALQNLSGGGQDQYKKIAADVMEHVITPLVNASTSRAASLIEESPSTDDSMIRLLLSNDTEGGGSIYESLKLLLSTMKKILFTKEVLLKPFAQILLPLLQSCLTLNYLDLALPSSPHDEAQIDTRHFESWLCENGWLPPGDKACLTLSDWCDQVGIHFARKRTTQILETVRKDILRTQWESVAVDWQVEIPIEPSRPSPNIARDEPQIKDDVLEEISPTRSFKENANPTNITSKPSSRNEHQPTVRLPSLNSTGFKSLFNFGAGGSQETDQQRRTASISQSPLTPPDRTESPSFRSLFTFGDDEPSANQSGMRSDPSSSSHTEKTISSPELIDPISELSSPKSPNDIARPKPVSPSRGESQISANKVDEDIDWDLGVESTTSDIDLTTGPSSSTTAPSQRLPDDSHPFAVQAEEVEEDAWGLEHPVVVDHASKENELHTSEIVSSTSEPTSDRDGQDDTEEENDPDGWGFEEEEIGDESDEVLRLRGGMDSTSSEDEEDGWAWNDEPLVDETVDISAQSQRPNKTKPISPSRTSGAMTSSNPPPAESTSVLQKFTISTLAQRLVELARSLIEDANTISNPDFSFAVLSPSSPLLIRSALDVFDLFRILMPLHHSSLLNSVPSLSAQFANDCEWLSKEIVALAGDSAKEEADKVSMSLKALSHKTRSSHLLAQRNIIMEYLDDANGFTHTSDEEIFSQCERACKQVIHTLEQLSHVWKPVMLSLEYGQSMGSLVESILERILREIEAQPDISEIESQRLNVLCKSLHGLSNLFSDDPQETSFARYVPSWFKFCFLSELLEASMADIMWMHQEGLLLEYSA
ncbi:Centromere/kinetochore Zw10-domain-containing protein [Melampsora americana]|nr:Centromere/kinetochore Zw10-domain-containing protein [Melampsora americana]